MAHPAARKLPWWTYLLPLLICHLGTRASLAFEFSPGVAILYLPIPLGIAMIQWWGPRVLLGVFVNAVLSAGLWGLTQTALYPIYALPETLAVFSSWLLFARLAKGRCWLPEMHDSILFVVLAILPAACFDGFQVTGQLVLLGDLPASDFWSAAWSEWTGTMLSGFAVAAPLVVLLTPVLERRGWSLTSGAKQIDFVPRGYDRRRFGVEVGFILAVPFILSLLVPVGAYWFIFAIVALWVALRFGLAMAVVTNTWIVFLTLVIPTILAQLSGSPTPHQEELTTVRIGLGVLCGVSILTGSAISTLSQEIATRRATEANLRASVAERVALEAQLRQAAKMDAVGQLAGGVAHDFNNMLTAINGYAELARFGIPEDAADIQADLDQVIATTHRASALTRQLLTFARKSTLEPRILGPARAVVAIEPMLRRLLGEHIELVIAGSPETGHVLADPGQLEQVILNLALNARDAMPDGGRLTIETMNVDLDDGYASSHPEIAPGPYVALAVSDTGIGMDEALQSRIFEPFFTTKEVGKGTGMGLSTVYGIVTASGGSIAVDSQPGRGTTFTLHLPRVGTSEEEVEAVPAKTTPTGSETVLVVEDDPAVRGLARRILVSLGYAVIDAPSGQDALRLARDIPTPIDLLLSDVMMPGIQGPELGRRLLAERPEMRILYVSGYAESWAGDDGPRMAGIAHLHKPYNRETLGRAVRSLLDGEEGARP